MSRTITTETLTWGGIQIGVSYEPNWLNMAARPGNYDVAHLQIEAVAPARARLPITETGYKSHFTTAATIESFGGPLAFVEAWLEEEAAKPAWQDYHRQSRQMTLF